MSKTLGASSQVEFNAEAFDKGLDLRLKSKPDRKHTKLEATGKSPARAPKTIRKPNLLHDIFGIRTLALFERHNPEYLLDVLSGLVIGYELQTQSFKKNEEIIVVGTSALQTYYSHALERLGACPVTLGSEATWRGFQVIAQTIDRAVA